MSIMLTQVYYCKLEEIRVELDKQRYFLLNLSLVFTSINKITSYLQLLHSLCRFLLVFKSSSKLGLLQYGQHSSRNAWKLVQAECMRPVQQLNARELILWLQKNQYFPRSSRFLKGPCSNNSVSIHTITYPIWSCSNFYLHHFQTTQKTEICHAA